jgi:nucleotide-binding universal stress UspA family protein
MRGISAAEHLMFGSTTEALLRNADVSVLAVPDGWHPPRPDTRDLTGTGPVVAAVELTETAMQAVAAAGRLAEVLQTSVEAIHVVPGLRVLNRWQSHASTVLEAREATAARAVEDALQRITIRVPLTLRVESGNVAEHVADAVADSKERHPLLVLGRRPSAAGATAYRILTLAKAPVFQYAPDLG